MQAVAAELTIDGNAHEVIAGWRATARIKADKNMYAQALAPEAAPPSSSVRPSRNLSPATVSGPCRKAQPPAGVPQRAVLRLVAARRGEAGGLAGDLAGFYQERLKTWLVSVSFPLRENAVRSAYIDQSFVFRLEPGHRCLLMSCLPRASPPGLPGQLPGVHRAFHRTDVTLGGDPRDRRGRSPGSP